MNEIVTYGYKYSEIDTITIQAFAKNSKFDAVLIRHHGLGVNLFPYEYIFHTVLFKVDAMSCAYDYDIVLKDKYVFRISNIKTIQYKPLDKAIGNFCTMYSYKINGRRIISNFITLVKPGMEHCYAAYINTIQNGHLK